MAMKKHYKGNDIITCIGEGFFKDNHITYEGYRRWYLQQNDVNGPVFYHFIYPVPTIPVLDVFLVFGGKVQLKCRIVEFRKKEPLRVGDYVHETPRDWMITTGPIVAAPHDIPMRGFQGFRYTQILF